MAGLGGGEVINPVKAGGFSGVEKRGEAKQKWMIFCQITKLHISPSCINYSSI